MIKINTAIHTDGGLTIASGSVLDVKPHFITPNRIFEYGVFKSIAYPMTFDVLIYKSLTEYKKENSRPIVSSKIQEFNVGHYEENVDIKSMTSIDGFQQVLMSHIENGDDNFSGVGAGKTELIYP